jgi:elongation factor P
VELPTTVVREIIYTEPAVKGDTSSGKVLKGAQINENADFVIQVPLFCNTGYKIEIDTRTDEYRSRAK